MILMLESTSVFQRQRTLKTLSGMAAKPYTLLVFRTKQWVPLPTTELLPGDLISLKPPNKPTAVATTAAAGSAEAAAAAAQAKAAEAAAAAKEAETAGTTTAATQAAARSAADAKALADAEKARADAKLRAARDERAKIERE